jgi:glutamate synthase domain-containing protein 3
LEKTLDKTKLLELCRPALDFAESVFAELPVQNTGRAVGTLLGSEISRRFGAKGLPEDTIRLFFKGTRSVPRPRSPIPAPRRSRS